MTKCQKCGKIIVDIDHLKKKFSGIAPKTCRTCRRSYKKNKRLNQCLDVFNGVKISKFPFQSSKRVPNPKSKYYLFEFGGKGWNNLGMKFDNKYIVYVDKKLGSFMDNEFVLHEQCVSIRKMEKTQDDVLIDYLVIEESTGEKEKFQLNCDTNFTNGKVILTTKNFNNGEIVQTYLYLSCL